MASTSQQSTWNLHKTRCEFCDLFTNNDWELLDHISSELHIKNRREFVDHHVNLNLPSEKKVPLSLMDTLKVLKLKNPQNVSDLAKKDFFQIRSSDKAIIANEFSRVLMKAIVQYESRHLSPELRQQFLDLFQYDVSEEQDDADDNDNDDVVKFDEISDLEVEEDLERIPANPVIEEQVFQEPTPVQSNLFNTVDTNDSPSTARGPVPDPNSTYIPKLAVINIKQEPKDD